ncbi:MAG: HD domain-containing phosphohydrolase [Bacillota bacterium]|nr:HD domain-containing phosphohydrolase [Bacillota bacterium]
MAGSLHDLILREAADRERLPQWAAYHHERLDGTGYPGPAPWTAT